MAAYQSFFHYCGIDLTRTPPLGSYLRELYEKWAPDRMGTDAYSTEEIVSLVRGYLERNRDWAIPELIAAAGSGILYHLGMSATSTDRVDPQRRDGDQGGSWSKTRYSRDQILSFLKNNGAFSPIDFGELAEGAESQAMLVHDRAGNALVLRIALTRHGFRLDQYAARRFGARLPIPDVLQIGKFDERAYFCLTTWVEGEQSSKLAIGDLKQALPDIHKALAELFKLDISFTTGYGPAILPEGDAPYKSWREFISESTQMIIEKCVKHARDMNIRESVVEDLISQYERHLHYASEVRRLLHGDPAHDNILIKDGRVSAMIDWSCLGYGDWMSDFATISFWSPEEYGDPLLFAREFDLDDAHVRERMALYWATNALQVIERAGRYKNKAVCQWLHDNLERRLL
ncbi:MAG: aminoglycoside phosphotransferase family protein [Hyphomicrobiales bacterium]|nr:aminoglycoside phosphotransferase family protein [Hyphomicrobiales bacterium]